MSPTNFLWIAESRCPLSLLCFGSHPPSGLLALPSQDRFSTRVMDWTFCLNPWLCLPLSHQQQDSYLSLHEGHPDLVHASLSISISCSSFPWHFVSQPSWVPCSSWPFHLGLLPCGVPCSFHITPLSSPVTFLDAFPVPLDWFQGPLELTMCSLWPYIVIRGLSISPTKTWSSSRQELHLFSVSKPLGQWMAHRSASDMFFRWVDEGGLGSFPKFMKLMVIHQGLSPVIIRLTLSTFPHRIFTVVPNYLPSWPQMLLFSITVIARIPSANYEPCKNLEIQSHCILNLEEAFWAIYSAEI